MCDPRYSANARTLYAILVTYADTQARDTGKGKPYRVELAAQLGVSVRTVDRTLDELEVAGIVTIERRVDPRNPKLNDANIYHLHDGDLWNGRWSDPLPPGQKAADVARQRTTERVAEKKAAGYVHKGGRPAGATSSAARDSGSAAGSATKDRAVRRAGRGQAGREGGVMGDATPSDTHDAALASPVTPNIYNPVHTPSPEPDVVDAAGPGAGGNASARREAGAGDSATAKAPAASGGRSPRPRTVRTRPRRMPAGYEMVRAALPPEVARPGTQPWVGLRRAIADLLDGNEEAGIPARTAEQVIARINRRWYAGNGPERCAPGYAPGAGGQPPIANPASWLAAAILARDCDNPDCEDGQLLSTGAACPACARRRADERAAATALEAAARRWQADVDAQAAHRRTLAEHEQAAAAEEARAREILRGAGVHGRLLEHKLGAHMGRWRAAHPTPPTSRTPARASPA
jgi:hypothetical protein